MSNPVAVLALVVSLVALLVAWSQLVLQREAAGGRGVIFDIQRLSHRSGHHATQGHRQLPGARQNGRQ